MEKAAIQTEKVLFGEWNGSGYLQCWEITQNQMASHSAVSIQFHFLGSSPCQLPICNGEHGNIEDKRTQVLQLVAVITMPPHLSRASRHKINIRFFSATFSSSNRGQIRNGGTSGSDRNSAQNTTSAP